MFSLLTHLAAFGAGAYFGVNNSDQVMDIIGKVESQAPPALGAHTHVLPADVQPIDLTRFLAGEEDHDTCKRLAHDLHQYGIAIIKDPRTEFRHQTRFLDMMEEYFSQPMADKLGDIHPEVYYQVGATPENTERARNHCARVKTLTHKPTTICPPEVDPKWRFFWRLTSPTKRAQQLYSELNAQNVIPPKIPDFAEKMDAWGYRMLDAVETVVTMAAIGLDLPEDTFRSRMENASHLLAPTGTDLEKYGTPGTVYAAYHYDINFMTIHGASRYPGLYVWLRDGRKVRVVVPRGCLLVQAGKQFEWVTGGYILAGFHEVLCIPDTLKALKRYSADGRPAWRVSSTVFSHLATDVPMEIVKEEWNTPEAREKWPPITVGEMVLDELEHLELKRY